MGEITEIVNTGVTVIKMVANHAGVETVQGGYATGFPLGFDGQGLAGGSIKKIGRQWKQRSDWYEFYKVDFDFTVGVRAMWGASIHGHGHYVDHITVTLDVGYLPADFTVDVTANFPTHGSNFGSDEDVVAGMPFETVVLCKGFLGQLVSFRKTFDCLVKGDGDFTM